MSHDKFRPLLAATIENDEQLTRLRFPLYASPKVDGIRCLIHPELGPVTRSLKPIRSEYIRIRLNHPENHYLDGEITAGPISAPNVFNRTTTCVMSSSGSDLFTYWVFDDWRDPNLPYRERWYGCDKHDQDIRMLPLCVVNSPEDILAAEQTWLSEGFEGIMLRDPNGRYKFNRSTLKEQTLLKLKRFKDGEAIIIGVEALQRNTNEQTRNAFGLAERSSHKAGLVLDNTLGKLLVTDCDGRFGTFSVGSGFDEATRKELWETREKIIGKRISYKYQDIGVLNAPRFPIWRGFRPEE